MAKTNSRYFSYSKNLAGVTASPTVVKVLIANSSQVKIGQMIRVNTSGFAVAAGVSNAIMGVLVGIIDNNGVPVNSAFYSGNTGHTLAGNDTVTVASDNQTRATAVYAEIEVATDNNLYYNQANGNLSAANLLRLFNSVSTSDQVDTATIADTTGQLQLVQLDPLGTGDLTAGLFRVAQTQLMVYGSGTNRAA